MDIATGVATQTRLAVGLDMDFPVIPLHLVTQPAKFMYMAGNEVATRRFGVLCASPLSSHLRVFDPCMACTSCQ